MMLPGEWFSSNVSRKLAAFLLILLVSAATPFSPQHQLVKTLYRYLAVMRGINSPVFACFVHGSVCCKLRRLKVKVWLDGAPQD